MATATQKQLRMDDTIMVVVAVLEERFDIPLDGLEEIANRVSGTQDREAKRARILELADELYGDAPTV